MEKSTAATPPTTVGIDLGDRISHVCVLDVEHGDVCQRDAFESSQRGVEGWFSGRPRCRVIVEAGTHSPWVSRLLEKMGHEVVVANTRKVRLISGSSRKTDRADAETLARLGRADVRLLHPIRHRSARVQNHLAVLRARDHVVRQRTALINHVRGAAKSVGVRLSPASAPAFVSKVGDQVPPELEMALRPLLRLIRGLDVTIARYDKRIETLCRSEYPATATLQQVTGVGPVTSLAFALTVGSPDRFRHNRTVGAYLGLCPWTSNSGEMEPQLHISKSGDALTRRLLVSAAQYILGPFGPDCTLRRIGDRLRSVGGKAGKKRAVIAVARRLAVLLLHLWRTGEVYEPLRDAPEAVPAPNAPPARLLEMAP